MSDIQRMGPISMSRSELIRSLISGSRQRAIQETIAALLVIVFFSGFLLNSSNTSVMRAGCALIVVTAVGIVVVVWAFALSDRSLANHPPDDTDHWLPVFHSQARLLRWVPVWYAGPICLGGWLFMLPSAFGVPVAMAAITLTWIAFLAGLTALNRRAASQIEAMAVSLADPQLK